MSRRATLFSATLGEDKKVEPPLGPLYIAAALEDVGWTVDFRDFQLFGGANAFEPVRIAESLWDHEPILMISCFVDMLPVPQKAAIAPILIADSITPTISREKDGKLRIVYVGWDDARVV
jgi:hypothetical protein